MLTRCKKGREGKEGTQSHIVGYIFTNIGSSPVGPISAKNCIVVGVHDVIIHSNLGVNIFRGFRSTGSRNFRFRIDLLVLSADATAQSVIVNANACILPKFLCIFGCDVCYS